MSEMLQSLQLFVLRGGVMRPSTPPARTGFRWERVLGVVAVVAIMGAMLAVAAFVWYPTTLQPNVTLTDERFVSTPCAPVLGGYANRFDATFTLVNTGRADGYAAVQFLLNGNSMGYRSYFVPQGSRVTETGLIIWEVYPSPADCGALGTPGLSLASVSRSPTIDERTVIQSTVSPLATLAFMGILVGALSLFARRRGISPFRNLGATGWGVGILTAFAASLFSGIVTSILITPYNYPLDWTPTLVWGTAWGAVGVVIFVVACREMLREGARRRPPE